MMTIQYHQILRSPSVYSGVILLIQFSLDLATPFLLLYPSSAGATCLKSLLAPPPHRRATSLPRPAARRLSSLWPRPPPAATRCACCAAYRRACTHGGSPLQSLALSDDAAQIPKPLLLEGSPGVGKTSLVAALAAACGTRLVRINLSEQTDMMDLLGADLPAEGGQAGDFRWSDGAYRPGMSTHKMGGPANGLGCTGQRGQLMNTQMTSPSERRPIHPP